MAGFTVGPAVLAQIASTLSTGATALDDAGAAPPLPQAGDCTEALTAAMALLCDTALQLGCGLAMAGDEVAAGQADYVQTDQSAIVVES